jgi:hypothetical protein
VELQVHQEQVAHQEQVELQVLQEQVAHQELAELQVHQELVVVLAQVVLLELAVLGEEQIISSIQT